MKIADLASATPVLSLAHGLTLADLYEREGLIKLDGFFLDYLRHEHTEYHNRLMAARAEPDKLDNKTYSSLLTDLAPALDAFMANLFGIMPELNRLNATHHTLEPLYRCKRLFIQRRAAKALTAEAAATLNGNDLLQELENHLGRPYDELTFATAVCNWLEKETEHTEALNAASRFAAWVIHNKDGHHRYGHSLLFKFPRKLDFEQLVPVETIEVDGVRMLALPHHHRRQRNGFSLTDQGATLKHALDEAHYCIFCHHQGKDSCSKGLKEKDGSFKKSPTDVTLAGCPLEEKISEMNSLKAAGISIGALAVVCIDNPMAAGTGHRICNDCMKSCIYQKQEPVNIPQIETRTLKDVLELPWGFEIYSLLTRWNPLNIHRPLPRPSSGYRVLVVGMGPAGYTLAHHLMNDGHDVVALDGLKIEPAPPGQSGRDTQLNPVSFAPVHSIDQLQQDLAIRTQAGFGGVAEYGITVRWDKNFLSIIRLLLERRQQFLMFGGIRFGSNLTLEDAWALGFDHVALCMGAGKPTLLNIPNGLARGVRTASDFLMSLQLTGAAKTDSIANLQLRLPVVVIGGGLTAIDTATEALAYYPVQVERFLARYEILTATTGEAAIRQHWSAEDNLIADEWLAHAKAIRTAKQQNPKADIQGLLDSWGGATLAYRRRLQDAPSYRLNHEEVELAMQEGIRFLENATPLSIELDTYGAARSIKLKLPEREIDLPARSILVAAGTQPNTVLARERNDIALDRNYFQAIDEQGQPVTPEKIAKPSSVNILMYRAANGHGMSYFGDLHPSFAGNVVKAMGSAKQGYPHLTRDLLRQPPANAQLREDFFNHLRQSLLATVHAVSRLTPTIVEVVLHAPLAAEHFQPGQFYRLQNYETYAETRQGTTLAMEGLALTGASANPKTGLLSTIVLEMGGSSNLCAHLKPGEPVILMGPTGTPTHIPANDTVLLAGGGLGNAVLFSIGRACREQNSRVLYFAGYRKNIDRYKLDDIEAAADIVIWCTDEPPDFMACRPQDHVFHGNIVAAMQAYGEGRLGEQPISLSAVNHLIAIGSDRMMAAVAQARHTILKPMLNPNHMAIGSINSPMQCMMKEICAQCLQLQKDPVTGEEHYVFSCFNQDQPLDCVSFPHLNTRLMQNRVSESLTAQWLKHIGV
ncbi:pyridine nucleotide-disulfide oxidoreductase [bacterium]|nr:pyridine nucleotide-disulfide oxidoreductase [bacterium]